MKQISDCISYQIGVAAKRISRSARDYLAAFDVTPVQYAVLRALSDQDRQTGAQLTALLHIDSATITGVLDRLVRLELIQRVPHETDRRVKCLSLTDYGRRRLPDMDAAMERLNEEVDRFLGDDADDFRRILKRVEKLSL